MNYNLSTQARLQAEKDICAELAKEGKVYIKTSVKALLQFEEMLQGLDFFCSSSYSWPLDRGKDGSYTNTKKQKRWQTFMLGWQ